MSLLKWTPIVQTLPDFISYKKENGGGVFFRKVDAKQQYFFFGKTNAEKFFFRKDL